MNLVLLCVGMQDLCSLMFNNVMVLLLYGRKIGLICLLTYFTQFSQSLIPSSSLIYFLSQVIILCSHFVDFGPVTEPQVSIFYGFLDNNCNIHEIPFIKFCSCCAHSCDGVGVRCAREFLD